MPTLPRERGHLAAGRCVSGAFLVAALSLATAGCSQAGDSKAGPVSSPIRGAAELTGFATTVPQPQDFVVQSRKGNPEFIPVGVTPASRPVRARSPEEVKALESELDTTLRQHNVASGRKPTGDVYKSAAAEAKPPVAPRGSDRFLIPPRPRPQDAKPTTTRGKPAPAVQ